MAPVASTPRSGHTSERSCGVRQSIAAAEYPTLALWLEVVCYELNSRHVLYGFAGVCQQLNGQLSVYYLMLCVSS